MRREKSVAQIFAHKLYMDKVFQLAPLDDASSLTGEVGVGVNGTSFSLQVIRTS